MTESSSRDGLTNNCEYKTECHKRCQPETSVTSSEGLSAVPTPLPELSKIYFLVFLQKINITEHTYNYAAGYSKKLNLGFGKAAPNQPSSIIGHQEYADDHSAFYTGSIVQL